MCDFSRLKQSIELEWLPSGRQVERDGHGIGEHFSRDPAGEVLEIPRPCAPEVKALGELGDHSPGHLLGLHQYPHEVGMPPVSHCLQC
jgi:hypothetical protein